MIIKDINGDSKNETLFAIRLKSHGYGEGILLCFDSQGGVLWRFPAGKPMMYGGKYNSADYRIHGYLLRDSDGDGQQEIYIISYHFPWELCQLAVLDCRGNILGEFWNAGYLTHPALADLDQDNHEELYVVGVNNEYGGGCLAVFDPSDIHGGSPQSEDFTFDDVAIGSEYYYIDFPRTEASLAAGDLVGGNLSIGVTSSRTINIMAHLGLFYELDATMSCVRVKPGHKFKLNVKDLLAINRLNRGFDKEYYEMLRLSLRYWSGRSWSDIPTRSLMHAMRAETSASKID